MHSVWFLVAGVLLGIALMGSTLTTHIEWFLFLIPAAVVFTVGSVIQSQEN